MSIRGKIRRGKIKINGKGEKEKENRKGNEERKRMIKKNEQMTSERRKLR